MDDFKFWKGWDKPYRILYFALIAIFLLLLVNYLTTYFLGTNNIIHWETNKELQHLKYFIKSFDVGIFNIRTPAYTYIIEERYLPGALIVNIPAAYVFIIITFVCLALLNTLITFLNNIYFYAGIVILIIAFLLLKFEQLGFLGLYNDSLFIGLLVLFIGVSYYFYAFKPDISFLKKFGVFFILYGVLLIAIATLSEEKLPLLILANHTILFTAILSILFILSISHEIIYGFLYLVTSSANENSKNTLVHFMVVSMLYFLCLFLLYFKSIGFVDLKIFGTDAFLILPFSVLLGIYGIKNRAFAFENILKFNPFGALLYLALGIICFSTLGYVFITNNDPTIEAVQDLILFSHIGTGIMFFIYIISNFGSLLTQNLKVYKVVYQPPRIPFYMVRFGGIIVVAAFLAKANFAQLNQAIAGYMNGLGDLSLIQDDSQLASQYYKIAKEYDSFNHKSNYSLAYLYLKDKKNDEAIYYLKESFLRNPSPYGYIQLSDIYLRNDLYFDAIYALKEGIKKFPRNGYLYNNLGLLYNKTAIVDSAYIFMELAKKYNQNDDVTTSNYFGFLARNIQLLNLKADSLSSAQGSINYLPALNNKIALYNVSELKYNETVDLAFLQDSALTEEKFSLLNNVALNNLDKVDSSIIKGIRKFEKKASNSLFSENLSLLNAVVNYYHHDVNNAFFVLNKLKTEGVQNTGLYNLLLGIWSLEKNAPEVAVDFFNAALEKGIKEAFYYKAIAQSEAKNKQGAVVAWTNVLQLNNPSYNSLANDMIAILQEEDFSKFFELRDEYKYLSLRYRSNDFNTGQADALLQNISSPEWKAQAKLFQASDAFSKRKLDIASIILNELMNEKPKNGDLNENIDILYLKTLIQLRDENKLKNYFNPPKSLPPDYAPYFEAEYYAFLKKNSKADSLFKLAIKAVPFDYEVIEGAVNFYNQSFKNQELAYNTSLESSKLNPYSSELLKLYILQCIEVNLINYATDALEKLKEISVADDYSQFEGKVKEKITRQQSANGEWH